MNSLRKLSVFLASLILLAMPLHAQAVSSAVSTVPISMTLAETLTLTVTGGPIVLSSTPGQASNAITIVTGGLIAGGHPNLDTVAYFSSTNALSSVSPAQNIATSNVWAAANGGAMAACGATVAGQTFACPVVYHVTAPVAGIVSNTSTYNLTLVGGAFTGLTPASFTGTLNIVAIAS